MKYLSLFSLFLLTIFSCSLGLASAFSVQPGKPTWMRSSELQQYIKRISAYHPQTLTLNTRLQKRIAYYKKVHILKTVHRPQYTVDCIPFAEQPALIDQPDRANNLLPQVIQATQQALPELKRIGAYFDFNPAQACPLGSVAILRPNKAMLTSEIANRKVPPTVKGMHQLGASGYTWQRGVNARGDLIQVLTEADQAYFQGPQNQYVVATHPDDHSLVQLWLIDKDELAPRAELLHTVELGLIASAYFTPAVSTSIFVFASVDHYGPNSCYNLECPNFIQSPGTVPLGIPITNRNADFIFQVRHIQTTGFDPGYYLTVVIHDQQLRMSLGSNTLLGYYPNSLYPAAERPKFFSAGAEVYAEVAGDGTRMYGNYANPFAGYAGFKTIGQFTEINNNFPYSTTRGPAPYGLIWKLGQN